MPTTNTDTKLLRLRPKQQRFVEEYPIDFNATQSAIRAGYSKRAAKSIGAENLTKPHIVAALALQLAARIERTQITQDMVLKEFARIGFADIGDFVEWGPDGVTIKDSADLQTQAVAEVSVTITAQGRTVRVKLHDKKGALDSIARHLGMFDDRLRLEIPGGEAQTLAEIVRDAARIKVERMKALPEGKGDGDADQDA